VRWKQDTIREPALSQHGFLSGDRRLHRGDHGFQVGQRFLDGQRVHVAPQAFAGLQRGLQIVAGDFYGQRIGDGLAGAPFVLHPCRMRQRDPDRSSIDQKLDVDRIGVTRGNGDDQGLVDAVDLLLRPAVGGGEVFKHG